MMTAERVKSPDHAAKYFRETDDYYSENDTASSGWFGRGAAALGFSGSVDTYDFLTMLDGQLPTGQTLGRNMKNAAGEIQRNHKAGVDLTFSAPKSVSVIGLVGGDQRVIDAHDAAVRAALEEVERRTVTRVRLDQSTVEVVETNSLTAALWRHETSRNQEAQLHTHAICMNVTQSPDGAYRAVESRAWFDAQRDAGHIYQQELGRRLTRLGYDVERRAHKNGEHVEIVGVPEALIQRHSSRSREMKQHLARAGIDREQASGRDRQRAARGSRSRKQSVDHAQLRRAWADDAKSQGHNLQGLIDQALQTPAPATDPASDAAHVVAHARDHLAERESNFSQAELERAALAESVCTAAGIADIRAEIARQVRLGQMQERPVAEWCAAENRSRVVAGFTTRRAIKTEQRMIELARAGRGRSAAILDPAGAAAAVRDAEAASEYAWNQAQRDATAAVLTSNNRFIAVQGSAGTAKTTTVLKAVAAEAVAAGGTVRGWAPTGVAAENLREAGVDMRSTVAQLLADDRANKLSSIKNETWIVDEASMLSAADMTRLFEAADKTQSRVVLVGDVAQLGSIGAGAAFRQLQETGSIDVAKLDVVLRQQNEALKSGVYSSIDGDARTALEKIDLAGEVVQLDDATGRRQAIADRYAAIRDPAERRRCLVLDPSRNGRAELNEMIRERLRRAGDLAGPDLAVMMREKKDATETEKKSAHTYKPGDLVTFSKAYKRAKIEAHTEYRVAGIEPKTGAVRLEGPAGELVSFIPGKTAPRNVQISSERPAAVAVGDYLAFTAPDKERGTRNGDAAHVVSIDDDRRRFTVRTDAGREFELDADDHQDMRIRHNYAVTVHAAQGLTADRVFAHAESNRSRLINQQSFYVSISRAKESVELFTDDREQLIQAIEARTGQKDTALPAAPADAVADSRRPAPSSHAVDDEFWRLAREVEQQAEAAARRREPPPAPDLPSPGF